jgi:hypothetical protein
MISSGLVGGYDAETSVSMKPRRGVDRKPKRLDLSRASILQSISMRAALEFWQPGLHVGQMA